MDATVKKVGGATHRRLIAALAASALASAGLVGATAQAQPAAATTTNLCSNPLLAQNLSGWGSLDGTVTSRDTVGDLPGVAYAFATSGHDLYQPGLLVQPGQSLTVGATDRLLNTAGTTRMAVDWYNGSTYLGQSLGTTVTLPKSTNTGGSWTKVASTFAVPAAASSAHVLQLGSFPTNAGTAFKVTQCSYTVAATTPSGVPMPMGDLPADAQGPVGWKQIFTDDFTQAGTATTTGALPDGKWWGYVAGTKITNSTNGMYDSSKTVSVKDGVLTFKLHSENGIAYAAVESPRISAPQTYGRYDVRYRYEPGSNVAGYKSVWMTWPDDDKWGEGELDFNEYANAAQRRSVDANLHRACGNNTAGCTTDSGTYANDPTVWHTGTLIWSPGKISSYVDGHVIATGTTQTPNTPMHLLLQTEASDYGPTATTGATVNIDVDWVTVYSRK